MKNVTPMAIGMSSAMKEALKLAAPLMALLVLAGCASSSGLVKNASPIATNKPVSLDFVLVETSSSLSDLEGGKRLLNDSIIRGLRETSFFASVSGNRADTNSASGIKIRADIKEINKVSDNARVWMGGLAGQARIVVQVTVTDLNSGNLIETFEAEGKSGKSARAGTTDDAIQRAAEQVVAEIVEIRSRTSQ
jgi:ABC-type uncharacterized transport system auxiliary subunit